MKAERLDLKKYDITPGEWIASGIHVTTHSKHLALCRHGRDILLKEAHANAQTIADLPKILQGLTGAYERIDQLEAILNERNKYSFADKDKSEYDHGYIQALEDMQEKARKLLTEEDHDATEGQK